MIQWKAKGKGCLRYRLNREEREKKTLSNLKYIDFTVIMKLKLAGN